MTPRQAEQQNRIFNEVRKSIENGGYEGLSMRSVAKAAGVATATLYNQYSSKDELVMAVLRDGLFHVAGFEKTDFINPLLYFFARTQAIYDDLVANPNFARAMLKIFYNAQGEAEIIDIIARERIAGDMQVMKDLQKLNWLAPDVDVSETAMRLTGNSHSGLLFWEKGFIETGDLPGYIRQRDIEVFASVLNDEGLSALQTFIV